MEDKEIRAQFVHREECMQSYKLMQLCGVLEPQAFALAGTKGSVGKQPKVDSTLARTSVSFINQGRLGEEYYLGKISYEFNLRHSEVTVLMEPPGRINS